MNIPTEIGDVNAILAETPGKVPTRSPEGEYSSRPEPYQTIRDGNADRRCPPWCQFPNPARRVHFYYGSLRFREIDTFFNMIGGLDKPTEGRVYIDEVDIAQLDAYELAWLRCRKIGYIFQSFNLIPVMTALENVSLPMIFAGMSADESREKGIDLLTLVGLGDRVQHKPLELSGGQQQRVAIARSLANDPAIVLADEPTGNLDTKTGLEIIALLRRLNAENGVTIITATHDHKMLDVSDRIFHMADGKVDKIESRDEIDLHVGKLDGEEVG